MKRSVFLPDSSPLFLQSLKSLQNIWWDKKRSPGRQRQYVGGGGGEEVGVPAGYAGVLASPGRRRNGGIGRGGGRRGEIQLTSRRKKK